MKQLSEGRKMFISVMAVFIIYASVFIIFEDYDRRFFSPFASNIDWHLLWFSLLVMVVLGVLLLRYSHRMDERISREQAERQNQMRRQLTQNIAHELKTPVASILGYTETILDNPDIPQEVKQQFVERTHAQAKRLTALLQDISTLNRMDYAPDMVEMERIDVARIVYDIERETSLSFTRHGMTLDNHLPHGIFIRGNASLVYSIFRNLVENALNYAGEGTTLSIGGTEQKSHWAFTVSDNGAGTSAEHLPRLFERFYRVDKGRSRSMGGTGLGLAIVKNAVLMHGGAISVSLNEGGGLRFDFTLKK